MPSSRSTRAAPPASSVSSAFHGFPGRSGLSEFLDIRCGRAVAVAAAGLALLLGACATPPPPPPVPAPPPAPVVCEPTVVDESLPPPVSAAPVASDARGTPVRVQQPVEGNVALLAYADRIRSMTAGEIGGEIARLADTADAVRGPFGDLQLAVALGQTRQSNDLQRAQALLQRLAAGTTEEARRLQPLGRLLAARYAEQRRVEDLLDRQNQAMRDSQRRLDQLNERLEAVRAIERSLTRSNGAGRSNP